MSVDYVNDNFTIPKQQHLKRHTYPALTLHLLFSVTSSPFRCTWTLVLWEKGMCLLCKMQMNGMKLVRGILCHLFANLDLEKRVLDLKLTLCKLYLFREVQYVAWGRVEKSRERTCATVQLLHLGLLRRYTSLHLPSTDTQASAVLTGTTSVAVSHLLPCWYHSGSSLAKINQILWKALYPLLRCVTDVRQAWLHLSPWRMLGSSTWTNASVPVEAAAIDKHGPICEYTVLHCTRIDKC